MGLGDIIRSWLYKLVLKRSGRSKTFDIIEVRAKDLTLTYINLETDVRIENTFFLPITIMSIETDIVNASGMKVGKMSYHEPKRLSGRSSQVFTTRSKMSNITALFNALQHLMMLSTTLRNVGIAKIKFLGFTFDIPVDDTFEVKPSQVRLTEELSEEEKQQRAERRLREQQEREARKEKRKKKKDILRQGQEQEAGKNEEVIFSETVEENTMEIEISEAAINEITSEAANESVNIPSADEIKTNEENF